jgi:hypothetical protein
VQLGSQDFEKEKKADMELELELDLLLGISGSAN